MRMISVLTASVRCHSYTHVYVLSCTFLTCNHKNMHVSMFFLHLCSPLPPLHHAFNFTVYRVSIVQSRSRPMPLLPLLCPGQQASLPRHSVPHLQLQQLLQSQNFQWLPGDGEWRDYSRFRPIAGEGSRDSIEPPEYTYTVAC